MPDIIVHSSMLSSVFPKKNPTAHWNGLSSDSASAAVTSTPPAVVSRCGMSLKQEKPPRFQGASSDDLHLISGLIDSRDATPLRLP